MISQPILQKLGQSQKQHQKNEMMKALTWHHDWALIRQQLKKLWSKKLNQLRKKELVIQNLRIWKTNNNSVKIKPEWRIFWNRGWRKRRRLTWRKLTKSKLRLPKTDNLYKLIKNIPNYIVKHRTIFLIQIYYILIFKLSFLYLLLILI